MSPRVPRARDAALTLSASTGGRWIVGKMRLLRNGEFSYLGKGCHTIYEAREVIDPTSEPPAAAIRARPERAELLSLPRA